MPQYVDAAVTKRWALLQKPSLLPAQGCPFSLEAHNWPWPDLEHSGGQDGGAMSRFACV